MTRTEVEDFLDACGIDRGKPTKKIDQIKVLAGDFNGVFIDSFRTLHEQCVGIQTSDPIACSDEAERRGLLNRNIYIAGDLSVVCWPGLTCL